MNARICSVLLGMIFLVSCQTVPVTQRQQLALIPSDQVMTLSSSNYREFLRKNRVVGNTPEDRMVQRVGGNIRGAVERYFAGQNLRAELQGYQWEFNLVEDDSVNAWAMPGGKVVVYSGILPIARDDAGLAVIMGHEIAHAVARHGNERMSQGLLAQFGGMALSAAVSKYPVQTQELFQTAFGVGSQVGLLLPFSRIQESEADHLGLIFMAMAGYDPRAAIDFWQRMSARKNGGAPIEFLSTHPSGQARIENIRRLIPEAMRYYRN